MNLMIPIIPNCHTCDHFFDDDEDGPLCDLGPYVPDGKNLDDPCDGYEMDIDYILRTIANAEYGDPGDRELTINDGLARYYVAINTGYDFLDIDGVRSKLTLDEAGRLREMLGRYIMYREAH